MPDLAHADLVFTQQRELHRTRVPIDVSILLTTAATLAAEQHDAADRCEIAALALGATEPAGVEMTIGHVFSPTGPRSMVGYHEFVQRATLEFQVLTMRDCLTPEQWADLWVHAQENGLGALRSQGFGRFFIQQWERIN